MPEIKFTDSIMCISWWNNLQIMDMAGAVTLSHIDVMDQRYRALLRTFPQGVVGVSTVHPEAPPSDAATAKRGGEILRDLGANVKHVSVVILGSGIKGMAIRTLMRTINVISRSPHPVRVHDSIEDAAAAVAPVMQDLLRTPISPKDVMSAVRQARNAYADTLRGQVAAT
jgi:hypothetical protein